MPGTLLYDSLPSPIMLDGYLRKIVRMYIVMLRITVTAVNPYGDSKEIRICLPGNSVDLDMTFQDFKGLI